MALGAAGPMLLRRGFAARLPRATLPACVLLAVLPDLDYPLLWLLHVQLEPRITHSLAFCSACAVLAWLLLRRWSGPAWGLVLFAVLLAAACSHLLLDYLVGVHPLPLLWPVSPHGFRSPVGLLPSAGRLDLHNPYLWRNLLIEACILGPAILLLRAGLPRRPRWLAGAAPKLGLLIVMLAGLAWSVSLRR